MVHTRKFIVRMLIFCLCIQTYTILMAVYNFYTGCYWFGSFDLFMGIAGITLAIYSLKRNRRKWKKIDALEKRKLDALAEFKAEKDITGV